MLNYTLCSESHRDPFCFLA